MLHPKAAQQISLDLLAKNRKFLRRDFGEISKKTPPPNITVAIPNYNNREILEPVLDSIQSQKGVCISILLIDNHSNDGSWEFIKEYANENVNISIVRTRSNLGPHVTGNILHKSSYTKYLFFASGNDLIYDQHAIFKLFVFLEENQDYDLAYGRNVRNGKFTEPEIYCLNCPGKSERREMGLSNLDAMDIATWLYCSNEPLWGLYRSDICKSLINSFCYGSDHVSITSIAYFGGIAGLDFACREVQPTQKTLIDIRLEQNQRAYIERTNMLSHPINNYNLSSLLKSYVVGLSQLPMIGADQDEAIARSVSIIISRFQLILIMEIYYISNNLKEIEKDLGKASLVEKYLFQTDNFIFKKILLPFMKQNLLKSF